MKNQKMYTIYKKGNHTIKATESIDSSAVLVGKKATIKGLGSIDSLELMIILIENGYQIIK